MLGRPIGIQALARRAPVDAPVTTSREHDRTCKHRARVRIVRIESGPDSEGCASSNAAGRRSERRDRTSRHGAGGTYRPRRMAQTLNPSRVRSEEHTSELQSRENLVCRLLLEKKKR